MSFSSYYSGVLARVRPGSPTADEARRDYQSLLTRVTQYV
jgi:hypothetical protein